MTRFACTSNQSCACFQCLVAHTGQVSQSPRALTPPFVTVKTALMHCNEIANYFSSFSLNRLFNFISLKAQSHRDFLIGRIFGHMTCFVPGFQPFRGTHACVAVVSVVLG